MKYKLFVILFILLPALAFSQNGQRISYTINSAWKFHKGERSTEELKEAGNWQAVNIPHTWNASDPFDDAPGYYRGAGWYVKNINIPQEWRGKKVFLYFKGVNQDARVLINNKIAGNHQGGYTAFGLDITPFIKYGSHNLFSIRVDNSYNKDIPPLNADFNFYGGIYRDVELIVTDPVHLDMGNFASSGVFVETPQVSEAKSTVLVRGKVYNETAESRKLEIHSAIINKDHQTVGQNTSIVSVSPQGSKQFRQENIMVNKPELWSPESPYLYSVYTTIKDAKTGKVLDQVVNPLGFRWFSASPDKGFYLNGKSLPLIGASRHQDFASLGNALTPDMHRRDFEMIKAMGSNFVRLAHYPQDPEVYKACDELGLLVWTEIPVVNAVTASDEFFKNCKQMQTEQIRQTYNHPSVIIYGYMNEVFINMTSNSKLSKEEKDKNVATTLKLAHELNDITKKEAPGRLTAMGMHQHDVYDETGIASIPDIVGWNLYFGWYYDGLDDFGAFLDKQHKKYPGRLMIVSEYGADADIRNFTFNPKLWDFSGDYQQVLHRSYLRQFKERPFVTGMAAWNFADFGAEGRQDAIPFINKKGLVTFDRSPKDVYYLYQASLSAKPVIHIVSNGLSDRAGMESDVNSGICKQPLKIFTNEPQIELFLNGRSLGKKNTQEAEVIFEVPFVDGENLLKASSASGLTDQLTINFKMIPALLNSPKFTDLAVNVGSHQYFWDKIAHTLWIPEQAYEKGKWGYVGGKVYNRNPDKNQGIPNRINGTINHPLFQSMREGIEDFRFDVADGLYEITLLFTEPDAKAASKKLVYDLSKSADQNISDNNREFDVFINGQKVVNALNLARDYGALTAVTVSVKGKADNQSGLDVKFAPVQGKSILSGIKIKRIAN